MAKPKEDLKARALDLTELVQYQADSIVSRTILDKDVGTVTLFAFAQGQALSEHTAPFDAMVHILDGEAQITVSGKPIHARAGQLVIMPADKPHALKAACPFKMLLIMIRA